MDCTRRTSRMSLRRVAMMAALAALLPAGSAEAAKTKIAKPVVTKVSPQNLSIGETLTVYGRNFRKGKGVNSVVFKRDGAPAVFVKADVSTRRQIKVVVPATVAKYLVLSQGNPSPTPFRIRVLAARFGKSFTSLKTSPIIGPAKPADQAQGPSAAAPEGDCDGDGIPNSVDTDDDNDLLPDTLEITLHTDPCNADTDGDGVQDGYEYKSAVDLNNDEFQQPNKSLPYPGKRPYPNPLDAGDANSDYDGDGLTMLEEFHLWQYTISVEGQPHTLDPLSYSAGLKYSVYQTRADGRRQPALAAAGYDHQQAFLNWASANGYNPVMLQDVTKQWYEDTRTPFDIRDFDRDGVVSTQPDPAKVQYVAEATYYDRNQDGFLSDDERDEDSDGLTNFDEAHGCMSDASWWKGLYNKETPYGETYAGTQLDNADSDGDGILDGADDQDHDDIPNIMECSRQAASDRLYDSRVKPPDPNPVPQQGMVNPFNPCEPSPASRTCNTHVPFDNAWAPFNGNDKYYYVWN